MSEQAELFYESLTDAMRGTVDALGGPKVVGPMLWPEKTIDEARRHLLDCLNPDRQHRLDPDHFRMLLQLARAKGVHLLATWLMEDVGYAAPQPTDPEDQIAELQRTFNRKVDELSNLVGQINRTRMKAVG